MWAAPISRRLDATIIWAFIMNLPRDAVQIDFSNTPDTLFYQMVDLKVYGPITVGEYLRKHKGKPMMYLRHHGVFMVGFGSHQLFIGAIKAFLKDGSCEIDFSGDLEEKAEARLIDTPGACFLSGIANNPLYLAGKKGNLNQMEQRWFAPVGYVSNEGLL